MFYMFMLMVVHFANGNELQVDFVSVVVDEKYVQIIITLTGKFWIFTFVVV